MKCRIQQSSCQRDSNNVVGRGPNQVFPHDMQSGPRKIAGHKKLRDEVAKLAEKYPDPAQRE